MLLKQINSSVALEKLRLELRDREVETQIKDIIGPNVCSMEVKKNKIILKIFI